jgi:hypothetical protein
MPEVSLGTFNHERSTKNTELYKRGNEAQYVPKAKLEGAQPTEVEVIIRWQ